LPAATKICAIFTKATRLSLLNYCAEFQNRLWLKHELSAPNRQAGTGEAAERSAGAGEIDPLVIQLVGRDPYWMREGARHAEAAGAHIVDINMGCPARKVVGGQSGSALMREPELAMDIIEGVLEGTIKPVTLKMRLGWDHDSLNAADIGRRAVDLGVCMLTVHGRTRCQFYEGEADWTAVGDTVSAVSVPVFVNGDINTGEDALRALEQSGGTRSLSIYP